MACYHPIPAFQDSIGAETKLWPPVGTATLELPCGTCLGCRTDRAIQWAHRARHEASIWKHNCFLTLTYNEKELPANGALQAADLQKFLKRLRRRRDHHSPVLLSDRAHPVRYLASGEYGKTTQRPHYHALLFNCSFSDLFQVGKDLYQSPLVNQLWTAGEHRIGTLTGASAYYVAGYTVKALGKTYCTPDGEILPKPFIRASLKPAIGDAWIKKNKADLQHGYLVADGFKNRIPRTYKRILQNGSPSDRQLADTISARATRGRKAPTNRTRQAELEAMERMHIQKHERATHTL